MTQQSKSQRAFVTINGDDQMKAVIGQQVADFLRQKGHQVDLQGQLRTAGASPTTSSGQQSFEITVTDNQQDYQSYQNQSGGESATR